MLFTEIFELFNRFAQSKGLKIEIEWFLSPVDSDYEYLIEVKDEDTFVGFEGIDGFNVNLLYRKDAVPTHCPSREEVEDALVANFGRLF